MRGALEPEASMQGSKGDHIVLPASKVGGATREGEIIQVIESDLRISYRVQWSDGHESLISPGAGAAVVLAAGRPDASARSMKPTAKKPPAKKKSTAKTETRRKPTTKKR
jgi:uncharacterized protein DUF1918